MSSKMGVVGASLFARICSFSTLRLWYNSCQYVCHKTVTTFDRLVHHNYNAFLCRRFTGNVLKNIGSRAFDTMNVALM